MHFRPCIDIHNGKVKQIVGSSLKDHKQQAVDNFVSEKEGDYYARLYQKYGLKGGHIILLNTKDSPFYPEDVRQAKLALEAYPGGLQLGGGVNGDNAREWIEAGASHVIVTSYIFSQGKVHFNRLEQLAEQVGKEHLVLDVSCRKKEGRYYIVTDRWQNFTETVIEEKSLELLFGYCGELLVHAVDVEGKAGGIDKELIKLLAGTARIPVTYAGGIRDEADIAYIEEMGKGRIDFTIGSALDLFGGKLSFQKIAEKYQ